MIDTTLPGTRTVSITNQREHWAVRARRAKRHRLDAYHLLWHENPKPPAPPVRVQLTRIAPRRLDDDNLRGALKAVRDGVADYLNIDDGDARVTWEYAQATSPKPREYAVRIRILEGDNDETPAETGPENPEP